MPRQPDGTYTLPNADVAPGDDVSSAWANSTMNDLAGAMTDSLDRNGNGGMRSTLFFADGTADVPGIAWGNEPTTGFYRAATGDMRVSILGIDLFQWSGGGAQVWDGANWNSVLVYGEAGSVPDGTAIGQSLQWNGTSWAAELSEAQYVEYDPSGNTIIASSDVQGALDEVDVGLASYQAHASDATIHFDDVPNDDVVYNRRNSAWIPSIAGVSDHDQLNGLAVGDDHPQYLNNARGDIRYPAIADYNAHVADTDIHFDDAPADGSPYARQDNTWVASEGGGSTPMVGEMRLFYGNLANLQPGWYFCDGTNGTPDLRGRVAFGAGGGYTEGVSAGATAVSRNVATNGAHTHPVTGGTHTHLLQIDGPTQTVATQVGTGTTPASASHSHSGNTFGASDGAHSHSTTSAGSHIHSLVDADPPHFVVTGYILYTGVI